MGQATQTRSPEAQKTYHNVIIFGAGASADAGIPLLGGFLDKMWEYARKKRAGAALLSDADITLLNQANDIRNDLEKYNSRASFDNRNLEDILSLLSFEAMSGGEDEKRYNTVVSAVARTIELSCNITEQDCLPDNAIKRQSNYRALWDILLRKNLVNNPPAIVTFNYDLVLERSLWQYFHFIQDRTPIPPVNSCSLQYCFGENEFSIKKGDPHRFLFDQLVDGRKPHYIWKTKADVVIPYFKLHGSLNWNQKEPSRRPETPPVHAVETPFILPPVFNKMNSREINCVWNGALEVIRKAKHIIIVGYSLPKTDIYMQYFLKASVGPNSDLQRIIVFNPALFKNDDETDKMKQRYSECFSPYFTSRIVFNPTVGNCLRYEGTFNHFVSTINTDASSLFYAP